MSGPTISMISHAGDLNMNHMKQESPDSGLNTKCAFCGSILSILEGVSCAKESSEGFNYQRPISSCVVCSGVVWRFAISPKQVPQEHISLECCFRWLVNLLILLAQLSWSTEQQVICLGNTMGRTHSCYWFVEATKQNQRSLFPNHIIIL